MRTSRIGTTLLLPVMIADLAAATPEIIPGTTPLKVDSDLSTEMVTGIDRLAMKEIVISSTTRALFVDQGHWRSSFKRVLGLTDERVTPVSMAHVATTNKPSLIHETDTVTIHRVRWPILDGVNWEGLLIQPKVPPKARVILLPDAAVTPEQLLGLQPGFDEALDLTKSGCQILIPVLISRENHLSGYPPIGKATNVTHREWIFRQAFLLGRHPLGYEVQATLAATDWLAAESPKNIPIHLAGIGEGGRVALAAAALEDRMSKILVSGAFAPRKDAWREPLDRTFFDLLNGFDDAGVAARIAPRALIIGHAGAPIFEGAPEAKPGQRAAAAPGILGPIPERVVQAEAYRSFEMWRNLQWLTVLPTEYSLAETVAQSIPNTVAASPNLTSANTSHTDFATERQTRLILSLQDFTQKQIVTAERERDAYFWKPLKGLDLPAFEKRIAAEREYFWKSVIGRLPDPDVPMNPRTRLVRETETVAIYDVVLDVWDGVIAWGWLALPKNLDRTKHNPVVVCQHGLEGLPSDCFETDETTKAWRAYKAFALRLAEEGFVTFAPHNPYRGGDAFRVLQRKFNLTGRTLFSPIIGQHQRILEWLKTQPYVDPERIAFYGLSYGGKSAMRIPAVLTDYCLSICSGDFNEWVRKNVSLDMPMSYLYTHEYEIWEWNLGRTFNYAEMAALIAPRPFMVERGHDDGVGLDEWVNYEFAKVRRLYNKLGIGDRTTIEHFDGPHTIHGVGTFEFLHQHLDAPKSRVLTEPQPPPTGP